MVSHGRWDKGYGMIELDVHGCWLSSTALVGERLPLNERARERRGGIIGGRS